MSNFTNRSPSESDFEPSSSDALVQWTITLNVYYTPFLVVFGSLGNLTSIYVFYNSKLRLQSTSQYLTALALSDSVFLWQLLPPWLNAMEITKVFHYAGFCQAFEYTSYVTCCLSAWLVVAFTTERYVAVVYPLRRNMLCTVNRARHVIVTLATGALLLNAPVLRFASPSKEDCNIDFDYLEHAARFNIVDTALSFTIPLTLIVLLNVWIMIGVCRLERARRLLVRSQGTNGSRRPPSGTSGGVRAQHRVTRMLLLVSTVFVIFNMPAYTIRILAYANNNNTNEVNNWWAALQQLAILFFNTNFGINFFLYCLSGQNFRRALCLSVPRLRNKARRIEAARLTNNRTGRTSISTSNVSTGTDLTSNCPSVGPNGSGNSHEPAVHRWNRTHQRDANNNTSTQNNNNVAPTNIQDI